MMKVHNFSAGPAILPPTVLQQAAQAVVDFNGSGLSLLEMSHRSAGFEAVMSNAQQLVKELLNLNDDYEVLFLSGGASSQFFMVPMNILGSDETACYVDTGTWANKALKEAKNFGQVNVIASSKESNYSYIPRSYPIPDDAKYLHLTSNNTIFGTQYHWFPETSLPIVCDMSSDIFSRPIPIEKFGLIYAGAQKNMGPAGTTLVVVRKDLMKTANRTIPTMLNYNTHAKDGSMHNTPPVFPIYVSMLTMQWVKNQGGLEAMQVRNEDKAAILYDEIDANPLFRGTALREDRSRMNVCFLANTPETETLFAKLAKENGCDGIKGHRSVGGFRASIYNAMEKESVQVLVDLMQEVSRKLG
jgi:phosphoserine aminotransferase